MLSILLLGFIIGSFLNVCIYRIPQKDSIIFPASHCGVCNHTLNSIDLIPILSFMLLKGRCRYCGCKISIQYPLVELLNGLLYVWLYHQLGFGLLFIQYAILSSLLLVISIIDLREQIIPDELIILGLIAFIPFLFFKDWTYALIDGGIGFFVGGGIFLLIALVTNGAMGGGDIKLMAMLGLWFGWKYILLITLLSFVIGAVVSVFLLAFRIKSRKDAVPFGPFISIASFIVMVYGDQIITRYLQIILG